MRTSAICLMEWATLQQSIDAKDCDAIVITNAKKGYSAIKLIRNAKISNISQPVIKQVIIQIVNYHTMIFECSLLTNATMFPVCAMQNAKVGTASKKQKDVSSTQEK